MGYPIEAANDTIEVLVKYNTFDNDEVPVEARALMCDDMKFQILGLAFDDGSFIGGAHFRKKSIALVTTRNKSMVLWESTGFGKEKTESE